MGFPPGASQPYADWIAAASARPVAKERRFTSCSFSGRFRRIAASARAELGATFLPFPSPAFYLFIAFHIAFAEAVKNAINDALAPFDARVAAMPFTPERILRALGKV